jgi:hypothetical protein
MEQVSSQIGEFNETIDRIIGDIDYSSFQKSI